MRELIVRGAESGQRLDKFLRKYLKEAPGNFIYKMLRKKNILLNDSRASGKEILAKDDRVRLFLSEETLLHFGAPDEKTHPAAEMGTEDRLIPPIVYEDQDILILNKPAGLLVQPGKKGVPAISDLLPGWLLRRGSFTEDDLRAVTPAPVNRLDRNTSGLVLCGKSMAGLQDLSCALKTREMEKCYLALTVPGEVKTGVYRAWAVKDRKENRMHLSDSPSADAVEMVTGIEVLKKGERCQLVRVSLITGRTHQIRAHLAYLGIPVAGDPKYGSHMRDGVLCRQYRIGRQMLHSWEVSFPETARLPALRGRTFRADPPDDFQRVLTGEHMAGKKIREGG